MSTYTSTTWPIAAKMAFGPLAPNGKSVANEPEVWRKQMRMIKRVGHTAFDPTDEWFPFWETDEATTQQFLDYAAELRLTIPSLSMGRRSVVDADHGEEYLEMAKGFVDFAVRCKASIVNVGFMQALTPAQKKALWFWLEQGHVDDPALRDLAVSRIQELADYADRVGVKISLEMYEDTFIGSPDLAVEFIRDVDRANVGLNPDLGNLFRLHREVPYWRDMYATVLPYANFWHIKNYLRDEDPATGAIFTVPASLENGTINYREAICQALGLGFDGPFVTEHYGGDWIGIGVKNLHFIRDVLACVLGE